MMRSLRYLSIYMIRYSHLSLPPDGDQDVIFVSEHYIILLVYIVLIEADRKTKLATTFMMWLKLHERSIHCTRLH